MSSDDGFSTPRRFALVELSIEAMQMSGIAQILTDGAAALARRKSRRATASGKVLAASSLGSCLVFVSGAITNVALSEIGRTLGVSSRQLQWVLNGELLPLAALTLVAGALGDRFGRRRIFSMGILMFGLGTAATAMSPNFGCVVVARLAVGVGEALLLPNGLAILGEAFPADEKARAVGIWSAAAAVASAVGPMVAGLIVDDGSWRGAFSMMLPLTAAAFLAVQAWVVIDQPSEDVVVDAAGALFATLALAALGWGLTGSGYGTHGMIGALIVAAIACTALIAVESRRGDDAVLPPAMFSSRSVVGANVFTFLLYGPFTVFLTLIPFVMIRSARLSAFSAGAAFVPLQFMIAVLSPLAGELCRRVGRRIPLIIGALFSCGACLAALRIDVSASYWTDILPAIILLAIGMSLAIAPLGTLILTSVDVARAGAASGINSSISRAGSLVAVALLGGILEQRGLELIETFHDAMIWSAGSFALAAVSVFIVKRGPHVDWVPMD